MLVLDHLNPPIYLVKRIYPPLSLGIGYHWQLHKIIPFSGLSREIFLAPAKKCPLSRENGNAHAAPSCIRVWGGGGGGMSIKESDP